jgi:hypothetical protein
MSLKAIGWFALYVCLGAVTITAFSPGSAPATQSTNQTIAASRASGVTFVAANGANPGGYASITVQTTPGAECSIRYVTPHGTISQAKGLENQTADSNGKVTWTWKIGSKTEPGTGSVTVTSNGASVTAQIQVGQ